MDIVDQFRAFSIGIMSAAAIWTSAPAQSSVILLSDAQGVETWVAESAPCSTQEAPIIIDSLVPSHFNTNKDIWSHLWRARLLMDYAQICRYGPGDWVNFEARVRGVPVRRGRAEVQDDMGWTGQIEVQDISSVLPPATKIGEILTRYVNAKTLPLNVLLEAYEASTDPAERHDIAYLIGAPATEIGDRTTQEQETMVSYLALAAEAGHPVAMFKISQLAGIPNLIYEATAKVETSAAALEKLDVAVRTKEGAYLLASAEANYGDAIRTMARAKDFGLDIGADGIVLSDTPTVYNADAAINEGLKQRNLGNLIPSEISISNCNGTWCHVAGGSKFRITVDAISCSPPTGGEVACAVTARFILTNDFDGGDNWQAAFMSMTTNAAPFNINATFAPNGRRWALVKFN